VAEIRPKKLPRQSRSRTTFDAIVEASARLLAEGGLAAVTTNAVAARAGVSIGSLYEFFPNREAILAVLTVRRLAALRAGVESAIGKARALERRDAVYFLIERIVAQVSRERALFRAMLREASFLRELPETREAVAELFDLGSIARGRGDRGGPTAPEAWLLGRMLAGAVLDIALRSRADPAQAALTEALAALTLRMLGSPPRPDRRAGDDGDRPG
jgi:AcrR family transcriptional regulator